MSRISELELEQRRQRQRNENQERRNRQDERADFVIEGRELKLRSPNGTYWSVAVDDAGVLSTVNRGTTL